MYARTSAGDYYCEGAVSLMQGERLLAREGYLELTGYGEPLRLYDAWRSLLGLKLGF